MRRPRRCRVAAAQLAGAQLKTPAVARERLWAAAAAAERLWAAAATAAAVAATATGYDGEDEEDGGEVGGGWGG